MVNGYNGKILRVDLTTGGVSVERPNDDFSRHYIGGEGFIAYYLLKELSGGEDALGPKNKLIFANGPITGVPIAGSGRNSVGAKSPLTNGFADAEVGGYWGAELKHAGYDAIIIEGKAKTPVYLSIDDDRVEIKDAKHLWGKATAECQKLVQEELGNRSVRIAQIGIAGENQVRFACIVNDLSHAAGRTGLGAVMGAKKLKAVAVRGRQKVALSDAKAVTALAKALTEQVKTSGFAPFLSKMGTAGLVLRQNTAGGLPTRNFQQGVFEGADKISGEMINEKLLVGRRSCYACTVRCKPEVAVKEPYNVDPIYGGPEYETLAALGSSCGIDNLEAIVKGNELCNAYGLDTISTGVTIAFAMECFERGILTEEDSNRLRLNFGNAEVMLQLVEMIANRKGIGKVLADGSARAASAFGRDSKTFAMQVKGQEIPMHMPIVKPGLGLGYAVSPTGADHNHNFHDPGAGRPLSDLLKAMGISQTLPQQELSTAKVKMLVHASSWEHTLNCLVLCNFVPLGYAQTIDLMKNITGWSPTLEELIKVGRRCITMTRVFNIREGMTKKDDYLPARFFTPFSSGPLKGVSIREDELKQARDAYYDMVGWDENGVPTSESLRELDIEWVARA